MSSGSEAGGEELRNQPSGTGRVSRQIQQVARFHLDDEVGYDVGRGGRAPGLQSFGFFFNELDQWA